MAKAGAEIAVELRAKLEFYLLALTFTVLGLAIQTAEFGASLLADALELAGWLVLFTSGVIGIVRAGLIPVAYEIQSDITWARGSRGEVLQRLHRGTRVQIPFVEGGKETVLAGEEAAAKLEEVITTLEQRYKATVDRIIRRYQAMRLTFIVGIGFLLLARGLPPALSVVERAMAAVALLRAAN